MPATPPPPSPPPLPASPLTSPQRHQQAARNQERNQRLMGSPEQRRAPAIPSRSLALPPLIVDGRELSHLPLDLRMQMINVPPHPPLRRRGHAPPQPFPLPLPLPHPLPRPLHSPPPPAFITNSVGSSSMAPPALGSGFVPIRPLPPSPPPFASSSRQTLDSAQLRALYVPLPNQQTSRVRRFVSRTFLKLIFTNNINNKLDSRSCFCFFSCSCSCSCFCSWICKF